MFTEPPAGERPRLRRPRPPLLRPVQGASATPSGSAWSRRPPRQRIDKQLLHRSDYDNHWQAFNIAKAVARFSFGLSKKDETSRLIEQMVDRINQTSSASFFDDCAKGLGGNFNLYGVLALIFTRSALQLHANSGVRDRKAADPAHLHREVHPDDARPSCGRTASAWAFFGRAAGAYGQMHCISLILQGLRDGWIPDEQKGKYYDILRRLFLFFYGTYLDQEHGFLDLRDDERTAYESRNNDPHGQFRRRAVPLPVVPPREDRADAGRRAQGRAPEDLRPIRHLRQEQPQGAGPLPLPRRRERAPPPGAPHQLRRAPLEPTPSCPSPTARGSSTGQTTSICRSCSRSSRSARTSHCRLSTGRTASRALAFAIASFSATSSPDLDYDPPRKSSRASAA